MSALRAASVAAIAACLAWPVTARAQNDPTRAVGAGLEHSSDTDGFDASRGRLEGHYRYDNAWSHAGIALQMSRYSQESFDRAAMGVLGIYRDQRRDTLAGIDIAAGVARVSGRLRPIGEASWRLAATPTTLIDFAVSADLVETPTALDQAIAYAFYTAGIEQQLGERFTLTALGGYQRFTDGNARTHLRARLIWLALPEQGVTLQMRYRQFESNEFDVGGAYFNPERYRQWLAVAAVRRHLEGWVFIGALGAGQERSDSFSARASYLAELRAEINLPRRSRLVLRAGYYRGAGFIDSPDYAYRIVGATLVVPF